MPLSAQRFSLAFLCLLVLGTHRAIPFADAAPVINEVMWAGSDLSTADEWVEFTCVDDASSEHPSCPTDVSGWKLSYLNSSGIESTMVTFPSGSVIKTGQFFLLSNYKASDSRLSIDPDFVTTAVTLPNTKLLLRLRDKNDTIIDEADDGIGVPFAGLNPSSGPNASMERIDLLKPGNSKENWKTAITSRGWDPGTAIFGTPGYSNATSDVTSSQSSESSASFSSSVSSLQSSSSDPGSFSSSLSFSSSSLFPISSYSSQSSSEASSSSSTVSSCEPRLFYPRIDIQSGVAEGEDKVTINVQALNASGSMTGLSCHFDFGDSTVSDSCNPRIHSYKAAGDYRLQLSMSDQCINTLVQILPIHVEGKANQESTNTSTATCFRSFSGVYITSILPNPTGKDEEGEWIELQNRSSQRMYLCGWTLDDGPKGSTPFHLDDWHLAPGGILHLNRPQTRLALNNEGDVVRLTNPTGDIISKVEYKNAPIGSLFALDQGSFKWIKIQNPSSLEHDTFSQHDRRERITITGALPHPSKGGEEWIELQNLDSEPILLNGWKITNALRTWTIEHLRLVPGQKWRFYASATGLKLSNTYGSVRLIDFNGEVRSVLAWDDSEPDKVITEEKEKRISATVLTVLDGDTMDVAFRDGKTDRIRLLGVDAPEIAHQEHKEELLSIEAKEYMKALLINKEVELEFDSKKKDIYGRTLAYVYLPDGTSAEIELLRSGLARLYLRFHFSRENEYLIYEDEAKKNARGIWSLPERAAVAEHASTMERYERMDRSSALEVSLRPRASLIVPGSLINIQVKISEDAKGLGSPKVFLSLNSGAFLPLTSTGFNLFDDAHVSVFAELPITLSSLDPGDLMSLAPVRSKTVEADYIVEKANYERDVVISEVLPSPPQTRGGGDGGGVEWIELFNTTDHSVNLAGWILDDKKGGGSKPWMIPIGTVITPHGFIIFASTLTKLALNDSGDEVWLTSPNSSVSDYIAYGKVKKGQSVSRIMNGGRSERTCVTDHVTPGALNDCALASLDKKWQQAVTRYEKKQTKKVHHPRKAPLRVRGYSNFLEEVRDKKAKSASGTDVYDDLRGLAEAKTRTSDEPSNSILGIAIVLVGLGAMGWGMMYLRKAR